MALEYSFLCDYVNFGLVIKSEVSVCFWKCTDACFHDVQLNIAAAFPFNDNNTATNRRMHKHIWTNTLELVSDR